MIVVGELFAAGASSSRPARLRFADGAVYLDDDMAAQTVDLARATVSDRLADVPRRVTLDDGRVFVTADNDGLNRLLSEAGAGRRLDVSRWERLRPGWIAVVIALFVLSALSLRFLLPVMADGVARIVPARIEQGLGSSTLRSLDRILFDATALPARRQQRARAVFADVTESAGAKGEMMLEFRQAPALGPNAIALPGGPVVMTDALVMLITDNDAMFGVLAHEFAHVEARHGLRQVMRAAGWLVVLGTLFGETESLAEEVIALVASRAYSRQFEREADQRAFELMRRHGADPRAFAGLLDQLKDECGDACGDSGWLSSHPGLDERITLFRGAYPQVPK